MKVYIEQTGYMIAQSGIYKIDYLHHNRISKHERKGRIVHISGVVLSALPLYILNKLPLAGRHCSRKLGSIRKRIRLLCYRTGTRLRHRSSACCLFAFARSEELAKSAASATCGRRRNDFPCCPTGAGLYIRGILRSSPLSLQEFFSSNAQVLFKQRGIP